MLSHISQTIMEYTSSVWDPSTKENIKKLEQVQKRAARFITNEYSHMTRVTPIVKSLNLQLQRIEEQKVK